MSDIYTDKPNVDTAWKLLFKEYLLKMFKTEQISAVKAERMAEKIATRCYPKA